MKWTQSEDSERLSEALAERGLSVLGPRTDDIKLMLALSIGCQNALTHFEAEIIENVRPALKRFRCDRDFEDEVLQLTRIKLFTKKEEGVLPKILEFRGTGNLAAWVQVVIVREALMLLRANNRFVHNDEPILDLVFTEPSLARSRRVFKESFSQSFHQAMTELPAQDRTLLRLCFVDGSTPPQIAQIYGVHRVTAFRWLREARENLLVRCRKLFLAGSSIPASEIDSVMRSLAESLSIAW